MKNLDLETRRRNEVSRELENIERFSSERLEPNHSQDVQFLYLDSQACEYE